MCARAQLNRTADIRFKAGVRVNLVRNAYARLHSGPTMWLGEYKSDAVGNCEMMITSDTNRTISSAALLQTKVDPTSALGRRFDEPYLPMAEQCAVARLAEPVVCCGEPRHCGEQVCLPHPLGSMGIHFWQQGQAALRAAWPKSG